jgi:endo-1,4-beta-xylanase
LSVSLLGALALAATLWASSATAASSANAQTDPSFAAEGFPISGEDKFLGSVNLFTDPMFVQFFNQVTPENAGKWGSAAGLAQTAPMRWDNLDAIYDFAEANHYPLNFHVLVWGNQQPAWMASLPPDEQLAEIEQWFAAVATRYPDIEWIQVVNEPLHDPPDCEHPANQGTSCPSSGDYLEALGGHNGTDGTGWDWVLNAFRLARQSFGPDAKLMINDYSITSSTDATTQYLEIIELLRSEGLIDAIGVQGHAFSTDGDMAVHQANLDRLAATGLPIQVTELDIDGLAAGGLPGDEVQLADYRRIFPTFWEHPAVEGVTLWGWRQPNHWRNAQDAPIVLSTGELKPAAHWLFAYVNGIAPVITPGQAFVLGDDDAVGTIEADDWASEIGRPDLRTFTWQITGGTGAGIFAIEPSTGEIRVADRELLDRGNAPYSLRVRVSDGFHVSDEAEVTIALPSTTIELQARPPIRRVGAKRKRVSYGVRATNVGTAPTGAFRICVKAPRKRVEVIGASCRGVSGLEPDASVQRAFTLKVKREARGRTTRIRFAARGSGFESQSTTARMRVGRAAPRRR